MFYCIFLNQISYRLTRINKKQTHKSIVKNYMIKNLLFAMFYQKSFVDFEFRFFEKINFKEPKSIECLIP